MVERTGTVLALGWCLLMDSVVMMVAVTKVVGSGDSVVVLVLVFLRVVSVEVTVTKVVGSGDCVVVSVLSSVVVSVLT